MLASTYCESPCQVLPNPLWKTQAMLKEDSDVTFCVERECVTQLEAWSGKRLLVYWDCDRSLFLPRAKPVDEADLILLHNDYQQRFAPSTHRVHESYFRLMHNGEPFDCKGLPSGFRIVEARPVSEAAQVADFISTCYADIHVTAADIRGWLDHPVFAADLWIWAIEQSTGLLVGLGVAEFDRSAAEGSLEWIQVAPSYRRRGLGTGIVQELVQRLSARASFVTVSGVMDSLTHPELLYRKCGFEGDDIWHVLRPDGARTQPARGRRGE